MWVWCHASHNSWPLCAREGFVEALISLCALTAAAWVMGTPHSCESREQSLLFSFAQMGGGVGRDRDRQGRRDRENIKNGKAHHLVQRMPWNARGCGPSVLCALKEGKQSFVSCFMGV